MPHNISFFAIFFLVTCATLAHGEEKSFIIGFRQAAGVTEQEKSDKITRAGGRIKRNHPLVNAVTARLPEEQVAGIRLDPEVAYVEMDQVFTVIPPATSAEYAASWGVQQIGAEVAAQNGVKGAGIKVAVLDSGIDYNHPDLKDNYHGGYNFAYDNNDPFDDSLIGHGTHVSGIIAAEGNGNGTVVGVAPEAWLYAVKVLDGGLMGSTSQILSGIEWAITNKMDVINMSFGMPNNPLYFSQSIKDACDQAYQAGIVLVAAAGNERAPSVDFPAAFNSVIAVSATAMDNSFAPFSNYGAKVEVAAPGVNIESTVPGGGYAVLSGSSMASPHVAGVAALLLSSGLKSTTRNGNIADEVRRRLNSSALDLGAAGRDVYFGFGLVEAPKYFTITMPQAAVKETALTVPIKPGSHVIEVFNDGLRNLVLRTPRGTEDIVLSNRREEEIQGGVSLSEGVSFNYSTAQQESLTFYPHGKEGSSADFRISGN